MQPLESSLWQAVIEALNSGVVVMDARGAVVYANREAARLLDRGLDDVLALDMNDLMALWQPERLDVERLAALLHTDTLGGSPEEAFQVATFDRRLWVAPFRLAAHDGAVTVMLLQENGCWRSDLITRAAMEELGSPILFAAEYSETLLRRIDEGNAYTSELSHLARVILNSLIRSRALWDRLRRLHDTDARAASPPQMGPVSLSRASRDAVKEIEGQALRGVPTIQLFLPGDLPSVRASALHLHAALCSLLAEAISRAGEDESMTITASDREGYVRVDLTLGAGGGTVRNDLFDSLPLAIVEQVIVQHGGRIWVASEPGQPTVFSFSLPTWEGSR